MRNSGVSCLRRRCLAFTDLRSIDLFWQKPSEIVASKLLAIEGTKADVVEQLVQVRSFIHQVQSFVRDSTEARSNRPAHPLCLISLTMKSARSFVATATCLTAAIGSVRVFLLLREPLLPPHRSLTDTHAAIHADTTEAIGAQLAEYHSIDNLNLSCAFPAALSASHSHLLRSLHMCYRAISANLADACSCLSLTQDSGNDLTSENLTQVFARCAGNLVRLPQCIDLTGTFTAPPLMCEEIDIDLFFFISEQAYGQHGADARAAVPRRLC